MENNKGSQMDRINRYADLIYKHSGKAVRPYRADGYMNMMTKYGTQKDSSEQYKYVPEDSVPDELLTMYYESNGLFAKIIDTPAEEAVKHGFELKDVTDQKVQDFFEDALDELDWEETAMTCIKWARLFGGSIAVMLINDGRGLDEPVDWKNIRSIDDIRIFDRSVIQPDYTTLFNYDPRDPFSTRGSRLGMPEYYQVFSKYGTFTVHDSRCLVFQNGILPENTTNSIYQFWGVPEYIRLNKAIRDAELAHRSAPKLLDRSVQPIYKMKDLSAELATEEGENKVLRRLQVIDMARGLLNSLVIDSEGEDYEFKTFQFSGINDVVSASCNLLSALSNIPQVILFGQAVGGLSTTDDTSMENYYNYVERIQKRMLRKNLRYLLSIIFQAGLATGEIDEVPSIKIKFNPLWSLNDVQQADLDLKKEQVKLTRAQTAQVYVGMQAVDPSEVRKKLADSEEFDVETMLDEYDDEDLFPDQEEQDAGSEGSDPEESTAQSPDGQLVEQGSFADYAQGVSVQEHNADPEEGGNAPAAAPAATKLPQDMSEEELAEAKQNTDRADGIINRDPNKEDGGPGSGNFGHEGRPGEIGGSGKGSDDVEERKGKIKSRKDEISKQLTEINLSIAKSGKVTPEDIAKMKSLAEEGKNLDKELENITEKHGSKTYTDRLKESGHLSKKEIADSLPADWASRIDPETGDTYEQRFFANLHNWTGEGYKELKHDYYLSEGIERSTAKWKSGDLYRGMDFSDEDLERIKSAKTISMQGISSWSSDISPAMQFASGMTGEALIIDKTKGERNALSIATVSARPWEQEVLYGEDQEFRVLSVIQKDIVYGTGRNGAVGDFSQERKRKVTVIEVESVR